LNDYNDHVSRSNSYSYDNGDNDD